MTPTPESVVKLIPQMITIANAIEEYRFNFATEDELHYGIMQLLDSLGIEYYHEYSLGSYGRIDLFLPDSNIGIEIKTDEPFARVYRQLKRYTMALGIEGLILITNHLSHSEMPAKIQGTPVHVIIVGGVV